MRRTLLFLALLVAGFGRAGGAEFLAVDGRHEVVADDARSAAALARPLAPALSWVSTDGTGPAPRSSDPRPDRPELGSRIRLDQAARQRAFEARAARHRRYASALALTRAGVHAFHTGTPPPFPLI